MTKWKSFDCVAQESLPLTLGKSISERVKNLVENLSPSHIYYAARLMWFAWYEAPRNP